MKKRFSGKRIKLVFLDDPYTKLKKGDMGTIQHEDDIGQIHVNWDNGSTLPIVPEVDIYQIID